MKLLIAGTRTFTDYEFFKNEINKLIQQCYEQGYAWKIDCIISGCARGADQLAIRYAKEYNIPTVLYPASWEKYGRAAGPIRNIEMANAADALIAFWDGKSAGTKNMIEAMQERQKELHVISIN